VRPRRRARRIDPPPAEDTILAKLEWFRRGGETSQRQWGDVLGVLRASEAVLDQAYLRLGAGELGVEDLLERAIQEAEAPLGR
jgi:hypothetical protein